MRMIQTKKFADKKILLLDRQPKTSNDRTWCYWETKNGFFDEIVYKKWDMLSFFGDNFSSVMPIAPYQYKMIRGVDFYSYSFKEISHHANIEIVVAEFLAFRQFVAEFQPDFPGVPPIAVALWLTGYS